MSSPTQVKRKHSGHWREPVARSREKLVHHMKSRQCPRCGGTGLLLDPKLTGQSMRQLREAKNISGRDLAAAMGFTANYICDLELGRRGWNEKLVNRYLDAVGKLKP